MDYQNPVRDFRFYKILAIYRIKIEVKTLRLVLERTDNIIFSFWLYNNNT